MLELLLCSVVTILPDYLYRRYAQGKRLGREITLYSVWFELRYGITACLGLTILLLTMILYFHPSTTAAVSFYRTIPILPEGSGRVEEVLVGVTDTVKAGQPLFRLDFARQEAVLETARRKLSEIDAEIELAKAQLVVSDAQIQEAQSAYQQALDELDDEDRIAEAQCRNRLRARTRTDCRTSSTEGRQAWRPWSPTSRPSRRRSPRSCRRSAPVPKQRWPKRRWNWTRRSCAPASTASSNSSRCARATWSTR